MATLLWNLQPSKLGVPVACGVMEGGREGGREEGGRQEGGVRMLTR